MENVSTIVTSSRVQNFRTGVNILLCFVVKIFCRDFMFFVVNITIFYFTSALYYPITQFYCTVENCSST